MERSAAIDRVETIIETIETTTLPVPIREVWVMGECALGLDPIERLDIYLTKDLLFAGPDDPTPEAAPSVPGVGESVSAAWASEYPDRVRTNDHGHADPARCLSAHLSDADEPIHFEICNASFEQNVTQRLRGAVDREVYKELLDPRAVCCWVDGQRSDTALEKLRTSELAFPTLEVAFEQLGLEPDAADQAAATLEAARSSQDGRSVRADVV